MARILSFPATKEAQERFARIEAEKASAELDAEIAEIHARVDGDIERTHGSWEGYGRYMLMRALSFDPRVIIGSYDA